jgi:MFS family permease
LSELSCSPNLTALFFSVPFGILADRIGRKVVCTLGVIGLTLGFFWYFLVFRFYTIFPLAAVYAFPLFFIIGGGGSVVAALIMAMISDVTPRDIRYDNKMLEAK